MCFVFIWEQTATCATYSINWLVFITEIKSVYSAVRTGSLNKAVSASSLKGLKKPQEYKEDIPKCCWSVIRRPSEYEMEVVTSSKTTNTVHLITKHCSSEGSNNHIILYWEITKGRTKGQDMVLEVSLTRRPHFSTRSVHMRSRGNTVALKTSSHRRTSVSSYHYNPTKTPYIFNHLLPTLYRVWAG